MYPRLVRNQYDDNTMVRKERLKVLYSSYARNPHSTIRELLGQDVFIKSVHINSLITDDECYVIDVEYVSIKFNPFEVIFVDLSDIKPIIPNSTTYAAQINGCNVKIPIPRLSDYKSKVPIHIKPKLSDNSCPEGQLPEAFSYYGTVVRRPMHSLWTPLEYPGHKCTPFKMPPIEKLYHEGYKLKTTYSIDEMKAAYKAEANQHNQFKSMDTIAVAKNFTDCKFGTTGYLIEFDKLPKDRYLNGIILIQSKRQPDVILYFPTNAYMLYIEELESIAEFLKADEINALNYDFVMNQ